MMPAFVAENFAETLLFTVSVLDRAGIRHIAHFGTLLGAVRLGGVCPWDEDADMSIIGETLESLEAKIRSDIEAHGFRLIRDPRGFLWVRQHPWWAGQGHLALEFMPDHAFDGSKVPKTAADSFIPDSELLPLRRYPFHTSWLWGPAKAAAVLDRLYGDSASSEVMSRFTAPPLSAGARRFWAQARGDSLDWPAISERFQRRVASRPWAHVATFPWWWFNGAWNIGIRRLRKLGDQLR